MRSSNPSRRRDDIVFDLVTDLRGTITVASADAAAVFGIDERLLLRKPLANFVSEPDRRQFRTFLLDLDRDGPDVDRCQLTLESRDGRAVAAHVVAMRRNGQVEWEISTEAPTVSRPEPTVSRPEPTVHRPAAADQARLFARVLTRLPHGVLVVDRDLRIVYTNPAARRIVGSGGVRSADELPDPWPDFSLRELAASLFTGQPIVGLHLVDTEDATYGVEGLVAAHTTTATLLLDDVTERERARRSERRFVENAAHELRTPLAAITSVVDVLESGAKDHPATRDSFLAHIRTHSERLTRLATSLLTLARFQTGQQQPHLDLVRVEPLLHDVASRVVSSKDVTVQVSAPTDLAVLADHDLLVHALDNIAANAGKHTRSGSIVFEGRDAGRRAEIEIRDTGEGMTAEESSHAFERFYRSQNEVEGAGFGLGLAIADEAVRVLNGSIRLDSTPNRGTRVRISLPSAKVMA
jgi:two-component system phosphate regulon sensor histidine kinase PhoR